MRRVRKIQQTILISCFSLIIIALASCGGGSGDTSGPDGQTNNSETVISGRA